MYIIRRCKRCIVRKLKRGYRSTLLKVLKKIRCRTVGYRFYCYKDKAIYELFTTDRVYDWYTPANWTIVKQFSL